MTREEINELAERAADEAVKRMLLALGIDATNPQAILEAQADHRFVRSWRESTEAVKQKAIRTAVGVLVTGVVGYLVVFFKWPAN